MFSDIVLINWLNSEILRSELPLLECVLELLKLSDADKAVRIKANLNKIILDKQAELIRKTDESRAVTQEIQELNSALNQE